MVFPRIISFDCAGTLLNVTWDAAEVAIEASRTMGRDLADEAGAKQAFRQQLQARWPEYAQVNTTRSRAAVDEWWLQFACDWGAPLGFDVDECRTLLRLVWERLYSPMEEGFRLYPDVVDCLERLNKHGYALIVVSNWDISLEGVLDAHGIRPYFRRVFASLVEGVEKPDPRLFQIAIKDFSVNASRVTHIGDDPVDDLEGARRAQMHGVMLDRSRFDSRDGIFANLTDFADKLCSL